MISNYTYRYFLIFITIFALYQLLFFYLIRPYYLKIIFKNKSDVKVPEVAFEVVYLMILILGISLASLVKMTPYFLWGITFLAYGLAVKKSRQSFFLASALIFKIKRHLKPEKQLQHQANIIFVICLASTITFLIAGYLV